MGSIATSLQTVLSAPSVRGKKVTALSDGCLTDYILSVVTANPEEAQPFYVLDLGAVAGLVDDWARALPTVRPFYAVKCNPDPNFLGALAALGLGFDCASQAEIEAVLALGVSPNRIIYANPCKAESHIKYAARVGVNLTTFDSLCEVKKIKRWHPKCAALLRLKPPVDSQARCQLDNKYGALPEEVESLLRAARDLGLTVPGISFHIGSGATNTEAYRGSIAAAKGAFDLAARLGLPPMSILNMGGGFMAGQQFDAAAEAVKSALAEHFPKEPAGPTVMAEPGRFFADTVFTLVTNIMGKRMRGGVREYWIPDGIYGSLNCIIYDHATVAPAALAATSSRSNPTCKGERTYGSTVFGPTCDGMDTVLKNYLLPELEVNDWLVFSSMGAYTTAAGSNFNGFSTRAFRTHLVYSDPATSM